MEDGVVDNDNMDYGDVLSATNVFDGSEPSPGPCEWWTGGTGRKRMIYVWLIVVPLCAGASFFATLFIMIKGTSTPTGTRVVVFLFNLPLLPCAIALSACVMYGEWMIVVV